jgi:hypothetical protein
MIRFPLMENKGVLHLSFFSLVKPKINKNKTIGGYHEN